MELCDEHDKKSYKENSNVFRELEKSRRELLNISLIDKAVLESLYTVTVELKSMYPDYEEEFIVTVLNQCSMNIQHACAVLADPSTTSFFLIRIPFQPER